MNKIEEEYDCQMEGIVLTYREFPDAPESYEQGTTNTWQECQQRCGEIKACKGFSWHNGDNSYAYSCSLFSSYSGQLRFSTVVSGPKECAKGMYFFFIDHFHWFQVLSIYC